MTAQVAEGVREVITVPDGAGGQLVYPRHHLLDGLALDGRTAGRAGGLGRGPGGRGC